MSSSLSLEFIEFVHQNQILSFGDFVTKSGRPSPYFYNSALCHYGHSFKKLCEFYARCSLKKKFSCDFDMIFGPSYKGITLAAGVAMSLSSEQKNFPFCSDRKESKTHGEMGSLIGAPLKGRVLIIDDVITAGLSAEHSINVIRQNNAEPAGIIVALDREEKSINSCKSTLFELKQAHNIPVFSIATLSDIILYCQDRGHFSEDFLRKIQHYQESYGATNY